MRTFETIINEWTDTLLELNKTTTIDQIALILKLGTLGQRLIYEANAVGMEDVAKMAKGEDVAGDE